MSAAGTNNDEVAVLDLRGWRCPLPVIKTEAHLRTLAVGRQVKIIADDPIARIDIPHYVQSAGHKIEILPDQGPTCVFLVTCVRK